MSRKTRVALSAKGTKNLGGFAEVSKSTLNDVLPAEYEKKYLHLSAQYAREIDECEQLLTLIRDDLKMRSDEDGVVPISNFIWQRLEEWLSR